MSLAAAMARARASRQTVAVAKPATLPRDVLSTATGGAPRQAAAPSAAASAVPIPAEISDVVTAVAGALALTPQSLMSDLTETAGFGRSIAAAIVARRLRQSRRATARLFGMAEPVVSVALQNLDGVLGLTRASATHTPLPLLVSHVIGHWSPIVKGALRVSIAEIQNVVSAVYGVCETDLVSHRRAREVVRPRMVAMYLARRLTLCTLQEIGHAFGGRDHATVMHALRKVTLPAEAAAATLSPDATIEQWVCAIRAELQRAAG